MALAIGLTLLMGLTIGLVHALMINGLRIPPFIATLATMAGLRSIATILCQNRTINVSFDAYRVLGKEAWVTLSIFSCVAVFMSILMGWTVLGRHLFALGGNETAARLSGLRTNRLKAVAYGLSGTLSALGGILFTGYSGQADSRLGMTYELTAITAAVVGGCSLSGGLGSIRGTVLGLLLTQIVLKGTGIVVKGIDSTQIEGLVWVRSCSWPWRSTSGFAAVAAEARRCRIIRRPWCSSSRDMKLLESTATNGKSVSDWCRSNSRQVCRRSAQRLENWKLLRAFLWPYFLRSTIRASRVSKPCSRSFGSRSGRNSLRARARPSMTAPDWLSLPLPLTLTKTSIRPPISVT